MARNNNNRPNLSNRLRTLSSYIPQPRVNIADNDRIERPREPDEASERGWVRANAVGLEAHSRLENHAESIIDSAIRRMQEERDAEEAYRQFKQQRELEMWNRSRSVTRGGPHIIQDPTESITEEGRDDGWSRHVNSSSGVWISDPANFGNATEREYSNSVGSSVILNGREEIIGNRITRADGTTLSTMHNPTLNQPLGQLTQDSRVEVDVNTYEWDLRTLQRNSLRAGDSLNMETGETTPGLRGSYTHMNTTSRRPTNITGRSIEEYLREIMFGSSPNNTLKDIEKSTYVEVFGNYIICKDINVRDTVYYILSDNHSFVNLNLNDINNIIEENDLRTIDKVALPRTYESEKIPEGLENKMLLKFNPLPGDTPSIILKLRNYDE